MSDFVYVFILTNLMLFFVLGCSVIIFMFFIPGLSLFWHIWIVLHYKKIRYDSEYFRDILSYTPSEIYYILNKNFHKNFFYNVNNKKIMIKRLKKLLFINLLKMHLLGYIKIDFSDGDNLKIIKKEYPKQEEYILIYNYIFDIITKGNELRLFEIYDYVEINFNKGSTSYFWNNLDNYIKQNVLDKGFYRDDFMKVHKDKLFSYYKFFVPFLFVGVVCWSVVLGVAFKGAVAMFLILLIFLGLGHIASINVIKVYSDYSVYEYRRIKALKKFLKDFTIIDERPIEYIKILEDYVVYAAIFDMYDSNVSFDDVMSNIQAFISNGSDWK